MLESIIRQGRLPVAVYFCRKPDGKKEGQKRQGQKKGGKFFPKKSGQGQAVLLRAAGHTLQAADALRGYQLLFCRNFDGRGAAILAFFAIDTFLLVPGKLQRACQGEQAKQGSVRAEITAPEIAQNNGHHHQEKHDGQSQV